MQVSSRKGPEAHRFALETRTRREQRHWIATQLDLRPGDRVLEIDERSDHARLEASGAPFDKAYAAHVDPSEPGLANLLRDVRRRLKPDGRIALLAWPIVSSMYERSFRPGDDDLVQSAGEALAARLRAAGFSDVRLRFKPTQPIASVCVTAVNRPQPQQRTWIPLSLLFDAW